MSFWQKLTGSSNQFDEEVIQISQTLIAKATAQSQALKINPEQEADKVAAKCGMSSKQHHPSQFMDTVFNLLCYPPELAYVIALKLTKLERHLGFQPFGTIMVAMTQVHSLYSGGMIVRLSEMKTNPELGELLSDIPFRAQKAGQMLARVFFMHSQSLSDIRELYHNNRFDPEVKRVLDAELQNIAGQKLARAIII